jgi:hypothetical protein
MQYEKLLEMAQRQAQVDDVRWSRLQTELASSQNLSVMIFTTFTVIFLPLTFFTGLFGMNTSDWEQPGGVPSLSFIGSISLPASFFLVAVSLVAAFSSRAQLGARAIARYVARLLRWIARLLQRMVDRGWNGDRTAKTGRRRDDDDRSNKKQMREARSQRRKERSYDFWADVRRQRNSEYQIPDMNRNPHLKKITKKPSWTPWDIK